jgi:hypothetical protein
MCGGCCRWAALGVPEGSVSDDAAGDGATDSSADGIGTRDGAIGAGVFGFALNGPKPKSASESLLSLS